MTDQFEDVDEEAPRISRQKLDISKIMREGETLS